MDKEAHSLSPRKRRFSPGVAIASSVSALLLAGHIYWRLGDYTADRGFVAFVQMAAICVAFGAMVFLVLETTRDAIERLFPGD
jgi:hypothetical protein